MSDTGPNDQPKDKTDIDSGGDRRRTVIRVLRLTAVVVVLVLIAVTAIMLVVFTGPPTRQDLLDAAHLSGKRELLIGVKDDVPGIALRDPVTGLYSGFDIEIAYMVAADLDFRREEVRFLPIETEDRPRMQASDGISVDLVVSTFSITKEREELPYVSFSAPYLRTEQSVVTRAGQAPLQSLDALRGQKVCTLGTSTSETAVAKAGALVSGKNRLSECVNGLLDGAFEAVTTDAAMLSGFVAAHPGKLQHHDIGLSADEAWGISTGGNEALRTLVNLSLYNSKHNPDDHRWEEAFERHLLRHQPVNRPQQVAVREQPDVPKVEVRQWPWDRRQFAPPVDPAARRER